MEKQTDLKTVRNKVVGIKQLLQELQKSNVVCVYLAEDVEAHLQQKIRREAETAGVALERVSTMELLGQLCGIEVGAACAGILKEK